MAVPPRPRRLPAAVLLALLAGSPLAVPGAAAEVQQVAFGSVAQVGDFDVAPRDLVRLPGVALCFADRDRDGAHAGDEHVYAVLDPCNAPAVGAAPRPVREGDVRLSGAQAGARVRLGDADLGAPLFLVPWPPAIRYADFNRDGQWSQGDTLYLHLGAADRTRVAPGDLRLTRAGRSPAGTFVDGLDSDAQFTTTDRVASGVFEVAPGKAWTSWDTDGDGAFGAADVLYLDVDISGDATVQDVRLTPYGSQLFGSVAVAGDADVLPRLTKLGPEPALCFLDRDGDNALDPGEPLYARRAPCPVPGPGVAGAALAAGDLRLSGAEAGTKLAGGDPDFGAPGFALAGFALRYADLNQDQQFSAGDALYLHTAADRATVTVGDLRLTRYGSLPAGSYVAPGDSDGKFSTTATVASGVFEADPAVSWRFWDTNGNAQFDAADMLYVDLDNGGQVTVQDVRLTPLGPFAFGSPVALGDFEAQPLLLPPMAFQVCEAGDLAYLLDRPCDAVQAGDLRLAGDAAGTRVAAGAPEVNRTLALLAPRAGIFDADGSGRWSRGDTLYLQRGNATGVAEGDLRLTAYGSYPAGTRVRARDADAALPLRPSATASDPGQSWRAWDADGDGRFRGADPLYVDMDGKASVGVLDVRLVRLSSQVTVPGVVAQIPELQRSIETLEATLQQRDGALRALQARLEAQEANLTQARDEAATLRAENAQLRDALARGEAASRPAPGPGAFLLALGAGLAALAAAGPVRRAGRPPPRR